MVKYTIENNAYDGGRITYSTCEPPKLTSTTLNTDVITWDKLVTKTRHTTSIDTIPGTTSTTQVDTTQTYKCEIYTYTTSSNVNKDEYMSFYIARSSATYVPANYVATDNYQNRIYTDSYTAIISDSISNGKVSITMQNAYNNRSTGSSSSSASGTYTYTYLAFTFTMDTYYAYPYFTYRSGYQQSVGNSSTSSSTSGSWRESEAYHALGTNSVSLALNLGSTTQTSTTTVIQSLIPIVTNGTTSMSTSSITSNTTSSVVYGNNTSFKFTTLKGDSPRMSVVIGNSIINSVILTNQNYNMASSLFYLGTVNVDMTTLVTGEREVY